MEEDIVFKYGGETLMNKVSFCNGDNSTLVYQFYVIMYGNDFYYIVDTNTGELIEVFDKPID